jgi:LysM repeat protein
VKPIKPEQSLNEQTLKRHLNMNNQSPFVSQNSAPEQKNNDRARVKIAVFVVLAINGIGLMALLMGGCQKPPETPPPPAEPTNAAPPFVEPTNTVTAPTNAAVAPVSPVVPPVNPPPVEIPAPAVPAGATEYTIVKGDILEKIAKKFHVSVKAITDANPGIEPTKLKIGQKIHIPAATAPTAPAATGAASTEVASPSGEQTYAVKSGDTLSSIAKEKGTTVKALRAANSLKTDRITVGQKLKIPVKASAPATGTATPAEPTPGTSTSAPPAVPSGR